MFAKHHYLSHSHNNAAHTYVAYVNEQIAGFISILHLPNKKPNLNMQPKVQKNPFNGFFCVYNEDMNNSLLNEFYPQISQKGYTLREVSKPDTSKSFPDRFDSYEEYQDALHDFLNCI